MTRCLISAVCLVVTLTCAVTAQKPSPTPSSQSGSPTSAADQKPDSVPAPSPESDFWHRETVTGDWGGTRTRWKERGLEMEFTLTGFVQGTATGGLTRRTVANGKLESQFNLDF